MNIKLSVVLYFCITVFNSCLYGASQTKPLQQATSHAISAQDLQKNSSVQVPSAPLKPTMQAVAPTNAWYNNRLFKWMAFPVLLAMGMGFINNDEKEKKSKKDAQAANLGVVPQKMIQEKETIKTQDSIVALPVPVTVRDNAQLTLQKDSQEKRDNAKEMSLNNQSIAPVVLNNAHPDEKIALQEAMLEKPKADAIPLKDAALLLQHEQAQEEQWNWKQVAVAMPVGAAAVVAFKVFGATKN